ncbi:MAG: hypothetical protein WCA27_26385 [Candidatus Sulfotelmatobacter sp.]
MNEKQQQEDHVAIVEAIGMLLGNFRTLGKSNPHHAAECAAVEQSFFEIITPALTPKLMHAIRARADYYEQMSTDVSAKLTRANQSGLEGSA